MYCIYQYSSYYDDRMTTYKTLELKFEFKQLIAH